MSNPMDSLVASITSDSGVDAGTRIDIAAGFRAHEGSWTRTLPMPRESRSRRRTSHDLEIVRTEGFRTDACGCPLMAGLAL